MNRRLQQPPGGSRTGAGGRTSAPRWTGGSSRRFPGSVPAECGGDPTGSNPADRGKTGTEAYIATDSNDALVPGRLFVNREVRRTLPPSPSWPASPPRANPSFRPCSPTKATTPRPTAPYAALSGPMNALRRPSHPRRGRPYGSCPGERCRLGRQASLAPGWSAATLGCWETSTSCSTTAASAASSRSCSRPLACPWLRAGSHGHRKGRLSGRCSTISVFPICSASRRSLSPF